jgi:hypothetical protein
MAVSVKRQADWRDIRGRDYWVGAPGEHIFDPSSWRSTFQWIAIEKRSDLPLKAGVYVVVTYDDIPIYVGSTSTSLRQRWAGKHHRSKAFDILGAVQIAYMTCDDPDGHHIYGLELQAMRDLLPILNDRPDWEVGIETFNGQRRFIPLSSESPRGWKTTWKVEHRQRFFGGRPRKTPPAT